MTGVTVLLIATSPRSTWITAPDRNTVAIVRSVLGGRAGEVQRNGKLDDLACDVGIGIDAYVAGELLLGAGFSFQWHDDQHLVNRTDSAWGIPVQICPRRPAAEGEGECA